MAAGDSETQLPPAGSHELGHLVNSFNDMTRRLKQARDEAFRSRQEVEEQRTYLEAVLSNMSSGVITVDGEARVVTGNRAAGAILNVDMARHMGGSLREIGQVHGYLAPLMEAFERYLANGDDDWREEFGLMGPEGRQVLMCSGTPLAGAGEHVIVFDDITALVNAQRDAAWSEVARRLAHEIKNPLTPIRLSAERVQHKFSRHLEGRDKETLGRLTHTIIQQVEAMKEMVDAFSNYARPPRTTPEQVDVNALLGEVLDLYRYNMPKGALEVDLQSPLPRLEADPGRLRQLFHNLIKNALEAERGDAPIEVRVATASAESKGAATIQITIRDNGGGFDPDMLDTAFEPYVTSKNKGSGLGLAIAKKIVEEHGGSIWAHNPPAGGACIEMRFPVGDALHRHGAAAQAHTASQDSLERETS
ncbi:MAG: ATP-binding protein [Gammaproteobacteria bacterium]|nr:ATP-binding protein [Gammaproteobacteria bacterium]